MKNFLFPWIAFAWIVAFPLAPAAHASQHIWSVTSPNHGQTYSYGSEVNRVWKALGPNNHLALLGTYSNEPFAEGGNRRYDYFTFNFPSITLNPDTDIFYYHAPGVGPVPVAARRRDFFGVNEIKLLPTSYLLVKKLHGYLTLTLVISDRPFLPNPETQIGIEH